MIEIRKSSGLRRSPTDEDIISENVEEVEQFDDAVWTENLRGVRTESWLSTEI